MADRTSVVLTILAEHLDEVKVMFEYQPNGEDFISINGVKCVQLMFDEINYGTLKELPKLKAAGISYDSNWDDGDGYSEGGEYCRFTEEGEVVIKTIYGMDENTIPLHTLFENIADHAALRGLILAHKEALSFLPFDSQADYGKRYKTKQLLS